MSSFCLNKQTNKKLLNHCFPAFSKSMVLSWKTIQVLRCAHPPDFVHVSCDDSGVLGPWTCPLFYCFLKSVSLCSKPSRCKGSLTELTPSLVSVSRCETKWRCLGKSSEQTLFRLKKYAEEKQKSKLLVIISIISASSVLHDCCSWP